MTHDTPQTAAQDPVCGMTVDPQTTKHTSEYRGPTYYFCSLMCRNAFEDNPGQYLGRRDGGPTASR